MFSSIFHGVDGSFVHKEMSINGHVVQITCDDCQTNGLAGTPVLNEPRRNSHLGSIHYYFFACSEAPTITKRFQIFTVAQTIVALLPRVERGKHPEPPL